MTRKLSVYLMKEDVKTFADAIKNTSIKSYDVTIDSTNSGKFYFQSNSGKEPTWFNLFGNNINGFNPQHLSTKTISALLLLSVENRIFAITFGYGRSLLKGEAWEEQFGLRVCMNSIDPDDFRVIERKNLDTMLTQNRTQMNQKCSINEFALDIYNILLKAVSGEAKDKTFAKKISGADSLSINCDITLADLPGKCKDIFKAYKSDDYKNSFPWMENLQEVPKGKIESLNNQLLRRIHCNNLEEVYLAIPEMIEWTDYEGFCFDEDDDPDKVDILMRDFYSTLRRPDKVSLNMLKTRHVYALESRTERLVQKWTVHKCLNCEIEEQDQRYILTDGKWFAVANTFVEEVNEKMGSSGK